MALALLKISPMNVSLPASNIKGLLRQAILASLALTLTACGNSFAPVNIDSNSDITTGGFAPDGRPYTGVGDPAALERVKRMVPPTDANKKLALAIGTPVVKRLGADGKTTSSTPKTLEIEVSGADSTKKLTFQVPVDGSMGTKEVSNSAWTLSLKCTDRECQTAEMKLSRGPGAQAAWVTMSRPVRIEVLGPFAAKNPTSAFNDLLAEFSKQNEATLVSHEVAWGASRFELKTRTICIAGTALTTGEEDAPANVGCSSPSGIHAALSGNSTRGDLLIRVDDGSAWAFVRVRGASTPRPPKPGPDGGSGTTPVPRPNPGEQEPGAILPIDLSHKVTEALELDRTNEEIQDRIRTKWKTSRRLLSFLNKAQPKFSSLSATLAAEEVPSEVVFITLLESNYFVCPNFPVAVSPVGAVGPWQFMPKTAAWDLVGLSVKPLIETGERSVKDRNGVVKKIKIYKADPADERGDLLKSTQGAAKYWKYLFKMFPSDPKLALMAYNWGPGSVDNVLDCGNDATCLKKKLTAKSQQHRLSEIQAAGFDYWTVRELNMAPKETLEYVVDFVSAQFVGRNPERYGISIPSGEYNPSELGCPK